jgi:tetratricopeptide (TPR) repeat protein
MSSGASPTFVPSSETLRAATRLERHVEWHEGFWLAYVFTISPPQAHILQDGVGAKLRARGKDQRMLRPQSPAALEAILADVVAEPHHGCVWVEAVREGSSTRQGPTWTDAWTRLILRANERRELIRGALGGGLVFVAPPTAKAAIRNAGPDLWSIRSFVFELPVGPMTSGTTPREIAHRTSAASFVDPELLERDLRQLPRALVGRDRRTQARIKARLIEQLIACRRYEESVKLADDVVATYRALAGDRHDEHLPELAKALLNHGTALGLVGRREDALRATREAVDLYRALAASRPDAFLPELAKALNNLGNDLDPLGRAEEAWEATREAVAIRRRLALERPQEFLPDLAKALNNLGSDLGAIGRREQALEVTREAVSIYRELETERAGDHRSDLATALSNLGVILHEVGRRTESLEAVREATALRQAPSPPPSMGAARGYHEPRIRETSVDTSKDSEELLVEQEGTSLRDARVNPVSEKVRG